MKQFKVYITVVEEYVGEAETMAEAEELAHAGQFGDAISRHDTKDIYTEEL